VKCIQHIGTEFANSQHLHVLYFYRTFPFMFFYPCHTWYVPTQRFICSSHGIVFIPADAFLVAFVVRKFMPHFALLVREAIFRHQMGDGLVLAPMHYVIA